MVLGEPKGHTAGAAQEVLLFWFKYRKVRVYRGFFPGKTCELLFVRRTTSFYNKKDCNFFLLEKVLCGMFQCDKMNNVEGELFRFRLCFINCESVLTF